MIPLLFLAGSPGPLELIVIFAVVLVLFGPRKLPEIAKSIGRMLHELRKASDDFRSQIMAIEDTVEKHVKEVIEPDDDVSPYDDVSLDGDMPPDDVPLDGDMPIDDDMPPEDDMPSPVTAEANADGNVAADDTDAGRPL